MLAVLLQKTWKAPRLKGLEGLIQRQNEQLILTYLIGVSLSDKSSFATNAAMMKAIDDIKNDATKQLIGADATTKGYLLLTLDRIANRLKGKPYSPTEAPPGSPIGEILD